MTTKAVAGVKTYIQVENVLLTFYVVDGYYPTGHHENELVRMSDGEIEHLKKKKIKVPDNGDYTHYKNKNIYTVEGIVKNPETGEVFVWCQAQHYSETVGEDKPYWAKPIEVFLEMTKDFDSRITRYQRIPEDTWKIRDHSKAFA